MKFLAIVRGYFVSFVQVYLEENTVMRQTFGQSLRTAACLMDWNKPTIHTSKCEKEIYKNIYVQEYISKFLNPN